MPKRKYNNKHVFGIAHLHLHAKTYELILVHSHICVHSVITLSGFGLSLYFHATTSSQLKTHNLYANSQAEIINDLKAHNNIATLH